MGRQIGSMSGGFKLVRLAYMSDLHLEFHADGGKAFIEEIAAQDAVDGIILAGDIDNAELATTLDRFCSNYAKVIFVEGNHEHYGYTTDRFAEVMQKAEQKHPNLVWLNNELKHVEFGDQTVAVYGGGLWYPDYEPPYHLRKRLADFTYIRNHTPYAYEQHDAFVDGLKAYIDTADIVISHHLPHPWSIDPAYAMSDLNIFFMTDLRPVLEKRVAGPAYWIHGHTHHSCDYTDGDWTILCNPLGYPDKINPKYTRAIVEVI